MRMVKIMAEFEEYLRKHYQCVVEFHTMFEYPVRVVPEPNIFTLDPKLVNARISFIESEIEEFLEAFNAKNKIEMADALCDILYFSYGTGVCFGYNMGTACVNDDMSREEGTTLEFWEDVMTRFGTIISVSQDFKTHCIAQNFEQAMSDLVLLNIRIYMLSRFMNFDIDAMYNEVHRSNMTKACDTEADAIESVARYKTENKYRTPCYKQIGTRFMVYNADDRKILKNYKWSEPNLGLFL
jgi:predicted HAD superfamily Cof-like phosphohydrolase